MSDQRFYVVGGEYADTSFTSPAPGIELERHGPLGETQAKALWRALTARTVDNAMVRYFLEPAEQGDSKSYWVVGGEYADSTFTALAPARELEAYGPFKQQEALGFWRGLTAKSVDDALVRYEIRKDYTPAGPKAITASHLRVRTKTKSVAIAATPAKISAYLLDGRNWPSWAIHNIKSARPRDRVSWDVTTPRGSGELRIRCDESSGVFDHDLIDGDGTAWTVPGRLIVTEGGTVVIMTFLKPSAMSESDFATDMAEIDEELATLRRNVEARSPTALR